MLSNLVTYRWFHRPSTSHLFCLIMSLFHCNFMAPLDEWCCDHRQHFDFFQVMNRIHDEKYHICPLINYDVIENIHAYFPTHTWSCFGFTSSFLLILEIVLVILKPNFCLNTISSPPRSIIVVHRILPRTLEARC